MIRASVYYRFGAGIIGRRARKTKVYSLERPKTSDFRQLFRQTLIGKLLATRRTKQNKPAVEFGALSITRPTPMAWSAAYEARVVRLVGVVPGLVKNLGNRLENPLDIGP